MGPDPIVSAVVPAFNEEAALPETLKRLKTRGFHVVVVDGGSSDQTIAVAREYADQVLTGPRGRARQMNLGAENAPGDVLFFVHADSLAPENAQALILQTLNRPGVAAGAFRLAADRGGPLLKIIVFLANWRARLCKLPYGDQGLFLTRETFQAVGGFADLPLMEDVDLADRVKARGQVVIAPADMVTSARRWRQKGVLTTSVSNLIRLIRYRLGASPRALAGDYPDVR